MNVKLKLEDYQQYWDFYTSYNNFQNNDLGHEITENRNTSEIRAQTIFPLTNVSGIFH